MDGATERARHARETADAVALTSRAKGSGCTVLLPLCSDATCRNFCRFQERSCPLHVPVLKPYEDKSAVVFCPGCYQDFSGALFIDAKKFCCICGDVYCPDCADFVVSDALSAFVDRRGQAPHRNPARALLPSSSASVSARRCCTRCAAALEPKLASHGASLTGQLFAYPAAQIPLDVCFVFQAGSTPALDHLVSSKALIGGVATSLAKFPFLDPRFMAVAYRGHDMGSRLVEQIPPQPNAARFAHLVQRIPALVAANAAPSAPASLASGLAVAQAGCGGLWRPLAVKVLFIIAFTAPHGKDYAGTDPADAFPGGDPICLDPAYMVDALAADGVHVFTVGVDPTRACTSALKRLAETGGGGGLYLDLKPTNQAWAQEFLAFAVHDIVVSAVVQQELRGALPRFRVSSVEKIPIQEKHRVESNVRASLAWRGLESFSFQSPPALQRCPPSRDLVATKSLVKRMSSVQVKDATVGLPDVVEAVGLGPAAKQSTRRAPELRRAEPPMTPPPGSSSPSTAGPGQSFLLVPPAFGASRSTSNGAGATGRSVSTGSASGSVRYFAYAQAALEPPQVAVPVAMAMGGRAAPPPPPPPKPSLGTWM